MKTPTPSESPGAAIFSIIVLAIVLVYFFWPESAVDKAAAAKVVEDRKTGIHCLSKVDGSHPGIVDAVKRGLHDPSSFEHLETQMTPVEGARAHKLLMKYRETNASGAKVVRNAMGVVDSENCYGNLIVMD